MEEVGLILRKLGERNGLEMSMDENGACTLELSDGRVMLIQERAALDELDFVAMLGPVPEEKRAAVFADLLAALYGVKTKSLTPRRKTQACNRECDRRHGTVVVRPHIVV